MDNSKSRAAIQENIAEYEGQIQRLQSSVEVLQRALDLLGDDGGTTPVAAIKKAVASRRVERAVKNLGTQEVFGREKDLLKFVKSSDTGASAAEAAREFGVTVPTVSKVLKALVADAALRQVGQKRGTRYVAAA